MIARLAELAEFDELREHFNGLFEVELEKLARQTFALPENHDRLEWERLRARYDGIEKVLSFPAREQERQRKESR